MNSETAVSALSPCMLPKPGCLFDPRKLYEIAQLGIGLPTETAFATVIAALDRAYPGHICTRQGWIFNVAGGAMGQLTLLHGSLREYIILFGSCNGVEGHSGRYGSEVFDFVFKGEMHCEYEGRFALEVHTPGTIAYLGPSVVKHYQIKQEAWMLEYARGSIPAMLPFGLADSFFSTLDFATVGRTLRNYGRLVGQELVLHRKDLDLAAAYGLGAAALVGLYLGRRRKTS
jgi:hypothetical protein